MKRVKATPKGLTRPPAWEVEETTDTRRDLPLTLCHLHLSPMDDLWHVLDRRPPREGPGSDPGEPRRKKDLPVENHPLLQKGVYGTPTVDHGVGRQYVPGPTDVTGAPRRPDVPRPEGPPQMRDPHYTVPTK